MLVNEVFSETTTIQQSKRFDFCGVCGAATVVRRRPRSTTWKKIQDLFQVNEESANLKLTVLAGV
jgi:hypothetical protein